MKVISACEAEKLDHMLTGAFAFNYYAIPRSTKDVDIVVDVTGAGKISALINRLEPEIEFRGQVQFDSLPRGKRHIGRPAKNSTLEVELFELFDDARDVLATADPSTLDMPYIENWCATLKTTDRLTAALARIPPI